MVVAALLMDKGDVKDEISGMISYRGSSDRAQWEALIQGMELAARNGVKRLILKGDSRSVINYMNGQFPARDFDSMDYMKLARKKQLAFDQCFFQWVPAERNAKAITLTKKAEMEE